MWPALASVMAASEMVALRIIHAHRDPTDPDLHLLGLCDCGLRTFAVSVQEVMSLDKEILREPDPAWPLSSRRRLCRTCGVIVRIV